MVPIPADEWRALTEHYRGLADEELLELAADFNDLTPIAQQLLRDELRLRKLGEPQFPRTTAAVPWEAWRPPGGSQTNPAGPVEYTWKTPLCDCEGDEQAWQIYEVLRRAGIESWVEGPGTYAHSSGSLHTGIDDGERRVVVAADQLEEARAIVARPIPQDIVEQSRLAPPEYDPPVCPRCGAADPILEDVEPANAWKCETCGARWRDAAAEPDEGENPSDGPERRL